MINGCQYHEMGSVFLLLSWEVNLECERFLVADNIESLLQYMWRLHLSYLCIHGVIDPT